jgi:hypothetical protein
VNGDSVLEAEGRGLVDELLRSAEPSVRWKVRRWVLGEPPDGGPMGRLREEIRGSARVRALLADRGALRRDVYSKWKGAHWVLATLADLGYPEGDAGLEPLRDRVLDRWLDARYYREVGSDAYRQRGVRVIRGRTRQCGSLQGNALLALTRLGFAGERTAALAERLMHWQWPDGGWNCDRNPAVAMSSLHETLLPMRGLAAHARATGDHSAARAARRAAEVLLERRLFRRRRDGEVIHRDMIRLRYPGYWHYNVLAGLRGIVDVGMIDDPRCADALDLLESKRLADGGWPAEGRYYRTSDQRGLHDYVDWGPTSTKHRNEWISAEALAVLRAAGRITV